MLGNSKPIPFDPYRRQRRRGRPPRWLVLLTLGIGIGAGGLYFAQERLLPPRLSASEGSALREAFESAEAARAKLVVELASTNQQLAQSLGEQKTLAEEAAASRAAADTLRVGLAAVVDSLPPDPRGGAVEVRAARLDANGTALDYVLLLTRDRGANRPLPATLRLSIAGLTTRGVPGTFSPPPSEVSIGAHEVLRGNVVLPAGFKPDQATVQVLERSGGKPLGMRVLRVR